MADAFPQIAWNKQCLQTLLDLVEAVGKSCNLVMVVSIFWNILLCLYLVTIIENIVNPYYIFISKLSMIPSWLLIIIHLSLLHLFEYRVL